MHGAMAKWLLGSVLTVTLLPGCFVVKTHHGGGQETMMNEEEFAKYVEQVFRFHNQVMNELIESATEGGDMDPAEASELSAAEARMIELCQPLNEVIAGSLTGESMGLATEMGLVNTVPACEEASHRVDELLP